MKKHRFVLLPALALALTLAAACGNMTPSDSSKPSPTQNGSIMPGNNVPPNGTSPSDATGKDQPVIPDSLAKTDANVTIDDLIATLGQKKDDLVAAMKDIATVGDGVDGARTYRHKLLGHDADVSYTFGKTGLIDKVTVTTETSYASDWKTQLSDVLKAKSVAGQTDAWTYGDSTVRMEEKDGRQVIIFERSM